MTEQSIAKKGILLDTILIIATIIAFAVIRITNRTLVTGSYSGNYMAAYNTQRFTFIALIVVSIAVMIGAIILLIKSSKKSTGFVLLIISAIVTLVLAFFGLVLGIITWILCGVSISQLRKLQGESEFESSVESNLDFGAVADLKKAAAAKTAETAETAEVSAATESTATANAETVVDVDYEVKTEAPDASVQNETPGTEA